MTKLLIIGIGGFIGAISRYSLSGLVHRFTTSTFPYGTLVVNVFGCLIIGALACFVEQRQVFSSQMRAFLMIGLLGAFTTFSTVAYETFALLKDRDFLLATLNVSANFLLGLLAVTIGWFAIVSLEQ